MNKQDKVAIILFVLWLAGIVAIVLSAGALP